MMPPQRHPDPDCEQAPTGLPLVGIVELKWLATGVGLPVHVERMQRDAHYAAGVLDQATHAGMSALARVASRLKRHLLPPSD
jgi:hypothetical protein